MEGTIENVEGRPHITQIWIKYTLKIPKGKPSEAERAIAVYDLRGHASQSVQRGIKLEWKGEISEE